MKRVVMLDTSIGSSNMGDHIIMECVRKELEFITKSSFIYSLPTHLSAFNAFSVWRNSYAVQTYSSCDLKFAGGSNLLVKNLFTHYPQWNINPFNSKPINGVITVGAGAGAGNLRNRYTKNLYRKVLNRDYFHSVRDERSKLFVEELGLKAINTGCVTMWMLTPDFCKTIPQKKASKVVFTITGRRNDQPLVDEYQSMIDVLNRNYEAVYFWVQGDNDYDFLKRYKNIDNIRIVPPSLQAYNELLQETDLDYVGTRLHGGIYAMRHAKRSIIIIIDERAREINKSNHLNCVERMDIPQRLEPMINSEIYTEIDMPYESILKWKEQFT